MYGADDALLPIWDCEPFPELLVIEMPPASNAAHRRPTAEEWEDEMPSAGFSDIPDSTESPHPEPPPTQTPQSTPEPALTIRSDPRAPPDQRPAPAPATPNSNSNSNSSSKCCLLL
jgi:hypothetical protein